MSANLFDQSACRNILLRLLSAEDYQRLSPPLEIVTLSASQVLNHAGGTLSHVYFPLDVVIHLYSIAECGATVQLGTVGSEGALGFALLLGAESLNYHAKVLNAGRALRIDPNLLTQEFDRHGHFQRLIFLYNNFFCAQVIQTAACNRLHSLKNRLSHWLLVCDDHLKDNLLKMDDLKVTHEFISRMLGTQRPYVTTGINQMENEGLIKCRRGSIKIIDRRRLEEASCECYEFYRSELIVLKANSSRLADKVMSRPITEA